ncbi:MAG TPA: sterol desaturase family protein [Terriglobales bacterium]|nr:sterol desaturase family protein [Terriglobales bacterium]
MPLNLIDLAIPAFLLLLLLEAIADARMRTEFYERQDTFASLAMGIGNVLVNLVAKGLQFGILTWLYRFRVFELGTQWWVWGLLFFGDEISYYWFHRTSHECRLFWASHVVHHSSQKYNLSTALRQTWTGSFMGFVFWLWLPLAGFRPVMILTMQAVSLLYQFWIHTEMIHSLGPLEAVLNTPSHHRVHHGSNPQYIDRNHGGTLIVWDRLFRSFEPERERVRYGLTRNINTYNPFRIAFHEWLDIARDVRRAPGLGNKLRYVFGRPGWSHGAAQAPSAD